MGLEDSKKSNSGHRLLSVDSFVVDLRRHEQEKIAQKKTSSSWMPIDWQKIKKVFSWRRPSRSAPLSFFKSKPRLLFSRQKYHSHSYHFSLVWPKKRNRFRLSRWHYLRGSRFNRMEGRLFAAAAAVNWQRLKKAKRESLNPRLSKAEYLVSWYRSLFVFISVLIIIILPFKILSYLKILDIKDLQAGVVGRSLSALNNLASASDGAAQLNFSAAASDFAKAENDFISAQAELSRIDDWLLAFASFSSDSKIKLAASGKKFLAAGRAAASMGEHLSEAGNILLQAADDKNWGSLIDSFVEHGQQALIDAEELQEQLDSINVDALPESYQSQFISFRNQAEIAVASLRSLLGSAQEIKDFLGVSRDKRYLLVFQNNAEMRGSGGFFGSYALVDIRDGRIRRLEVPAGGSYDTEAGMKNFIQSPKPLWLVSPRWYFWDANWWPDWPTSARSLMWFYEKSGGPTVDGVISFTPDVLSDLLKITGPIDMQAEYGLTIDTDNFWDLIQATVEKENLIKTHPEEVAALPDSPENQPKKIIGDLMAEIMDRLPRILTFEKLPFLISALEKNLSSKNIMLYFSDPSLQDKAARYGFDGAMLPSRQDYLLIAHTNIAGQKSDRKMRDELKHSVQILSDRSVIDTLTITRTHTGLKNEILSGVRNVDWLRVYVPAGSQLLEASGFRTPDASYFEEPEDNWETLPLIEETEGRALTDLVSGTKIYEENGKTVFANWVMVDPGETVVIKLRYRLPFRLEAESKDSSGDWLARLGSLLDKAPGERFAFSLLLQKQPGAKAAGVDFEITTPSAWRQIWNYPNQTPWNGSSSLDRDIMRAVLLEK
ncbi:MAG: DUF4012 domain-containing protein [Patescibacteria group bacterium]|nr:DUF4012 domain-containing protein [Patescibacteria group bacterium]